MNCNSCKSKNVIASFGVLEGSVLEPLSFKIFINDVIHDLLYTDDLKFYHDINFASDRFNLQSSFDNVSRWCQSDNLIMNIEKCNVVSFGLNCNKL